jgi:GDP-4-dehydro-6-deoxy-D-mannose reductase
VKVLLTGGNGFVAPFLAHELARAGHDVFITGHKPREDLDFPFMEADLSDRSQAYEVIKWASSDAVVHLAGISNVAAADADRARKIVSSNIDTTHFMCEAMHRLQRPAAFLFVSTGLVYKPISDLNFPGYDEESALGPVNDYGWTKLSAEALVRVYNSQLLKTYIARPFNHTGPGQDLRFVCPTLADRVIKARSGDKIPVGNLQAERDFSDVRDIVRAYRLILEQKPEQRTFVLGSGQARPISEILSFFLEYSGKNISFEVSQDLLRTEHDRVCSRPELAQKVLNWVPAIPLSRTLADLYDFVQESSAKA